MVRVGVPREIAPGETRVALIPETVAKLAKSGYQVVVESSAGLAAGYPDDAYASAGATIAHSPRDVAGVDVVLKVREPMAIAGGGHEVDQLSAGSALIGFLDPARSGELLERLARARVTAFAMELIPRITRAQKMDALSSMSTVAGYKAALLAADTIGRFFPLLMTAAGTIAPARVLVLGAGVAGLQAIATSRRLGGVVEAFDVRPAVRDEVKSLGATFIGEELVSEAAVDRGGYAREVAADQQAKIRDLIHRHVKSSDVVIATANIPGRRAPVLVTAAMVQDMKSGSVIVDLAAETGGNCELTEPGRSTLRGGVTIHGPINITAQLPTHASMMYSRNIAALLQQLTKDGKLNIDMQDEITRESCVTHDGRVLKGAAATPASSAPAPSGGVPAGIPTGTAS